MSADSFARGYSMFVTYLAEPAVRSLVIGCVTGVALWAFRVKRVNTHLLAWTAVLCAALAMPVLGAFLPRVQMPVPATPLMKSLQTSFERGPARTVRHEVAASAALVQSASTVSHAGASETEFAPSSESSSGLALDRSAHTTTKAAVARHARRRPGFDATQFNFSAAPGAVSASTLAPNVSSTPIPASMSTDSIPSIAETPQGSFSIPWTAVVLGIYLFGIVILLVRLLVGFFFSARLSRAAENISDREALRLMRFRACIAGLANTPGLKESAMLAVPATVGVHRVVILLPADWRAWTEEQLDAILAHEISHVARRDALTQMLSLVHRAIFWFSPLSWWLDKQLTDLAEQASDEAALAGGADRARYAETLVGFFKQLGAASGRVWWQGVSMAKTAKAGSAERRVSRILAWKESMSIKKSFVLAMFTLAVPIVFFTASVHPFIAQAQDKPPAPPQNVVQPGGPAAPAFPNAPKGGVRGGVAAPATIGTPPATGPARPNAPTGGVNGSVAAPPNVGAAPIAPPALAGPRVLRSSQIPATALTTPAMPPSVSSASVTPFASETPLAPLAPRAGYVDDDASTQEQSSTTTIVSGSVSYGGGPRYVLMYANSDVSMSGSDEDLDHARKLRKKISSDFIWFERDEKSYIITDAQFIAKVKGLFAPEDALAKQQDELGHQEDALGRKQDALGEQEDNIKVKVPDISPDIDRVRAELEELCKENGATQSELGRLQSELGELQSQVGSYQSQAGVQQSSIGVRQGDLGRQQAELGRKQAELGRQESEIDRNATRQLRGMFDDAIAKGIAKPE